MNKKLIIGIVVLALGLGGWKMWTDSSRVDSKEKQTATDVKQEEESNKDSENKQDKLFTESSNISNNSSEEGASNKSSSNNTQNKDVNKNDSNKGASSDKNISISDSIKLPYTISDADVKIEKITSYSGKFVEDGSDKNVSNIISLVVKNISKKDIQYCSIEMLIGDNKKVIFNITNLPSGKTATVLESTGKVSYKSGSKYNVTNCTYAVVEQLPMNSNKVKVSTSGSSITIKNTSNKDLGTVYVYYKNMKNGSYLGGITYRAKFENVDKGKKLTAQTSHFSKSSKVVMVDTEK